MTEDEYQPVFETLVNHIPKELDSSHKQSLKGRIKYGYQFSLAKRLKLLLDDVLKDHEWFSDLIIEDRKKFIRKIKSTRNYLTHFEEDDEEKPIKDLQELYAFATRMRWLLRVCFLIELGMSSETINTLLKRNLYVTTY
jgi:hypothetical protein